MLSSEHERHIFGVFEVLARSGVRYYFIVTADAANVDMLACETCSTPAQEQVGPLLTLTDGPHSQSRFALLKDTLRKAWKS